MHLGGAELCTTAQDTNGRKWSRPILCMMLLHIHILHEPKSLLLFPFPFSCLLGCALPLPSISISAAHCLPLLTGHEQDEPVDRPPPNSQATYWVLGTGDAQGICANWVQLCQPSWPDWGCLGFGQGTSTRYLGGRPWLPPAGQACLHIHIPKMNARPSWPNKGSIQHIQHIQTEKQVRVRIKRRQAETEMATPQRGNPGITAKICISVLFSWSSIPYSAANRPTGWQTHTHTLVCLLRQWPPVSLSLSSFFFFGSEICAAYIPKELMLHDMMLSISPTLVPKSEWLVPGVAQC